MRKEITKCCGIFKLKATVWRDPEAWQKIMSHVLVIRCEFRHWSRDLHYEAYSNLFAEIEDGTWPLPYQVGINESGEVIAIPLPEGEVL